MKEVSKLKSFIMSVKQWNLNTDFQIWPPCYSISRFDVLQYRRTLLIFCLCYLFFSTSVVTWVYCLDIPSKMVFSLSFRLLMCSQGCARLFLRHFKCFSSQIKFSITFICVSFSVYAVSRVFLHIHISGSLNIVYFFCNVDSI